LPSTRAIPDRDVFYVADPISSIRAERFFGFFAGAYDRERQAKEVNAAPQLWPEVF
jgi:hypothetical protein